MLYAQDSVAELSVPSYSIINKLGSAKSYPRTDSR